MEDEDGGEVDQDEYAHDCRIHLFERIILDNPISEAIRFGDVAEVELEHVDGIEEGGQQPAFLGFESFNHDLGGVVRNVQGGLEEDDDVTHEVHRAKQPAY